MVIKYRLIILLLLLSSTVMGQSLAPSGNYNTLNVFNGGTKSTRAMIAPKGFQPWATYDTTGFIWLDTVNHFLYYHNGTSRVQLGAGGGSGTVTNVSTGFGMLGGPITTTGTVRVDSNYIMTVARGYKVADSVADSRVPYTGANQPLNLGTQNLITDTITGTGSGGLHLHGSASNSGIEIANFGQVRMDYYPIANSGDSVLTTNSQGFIQVYNLKGNYVPYTGATNNLDMGNYQVTAKRANLDTLEPNSSAGLHLHNTSHQDIFIAGAGGGQNLTIYAPTSFSLMANQNETDTVLGSTSTGLVKKIGIATTYLKKSDSSLYATQYRVDTAAFNALTRINTKGTVSSVALANGFGLSVSGSPVTGTGTITATVDTTLVATMADVNAATRDTVALSNRISLLNTLQGASIASADTINLLTTTGNVVDVTGTTTIRGLSPSASANSALIGARRVVRFTGALTLTYNATTNILPGSANITTVNGDMAEFVYLGGVSWVCMDYTKRTVTGTGSTVLAASPSITGTLTAAAITASGTLTANGTLTLTGGTGASTSGFATGVTTSGNTKAVNLGTGGASGSTTNIAIGATAGTSTTTLNGTVTVANVSTVSGTVVSNTGAQTLTNKRITYRTITAASYTTSVTIPADSVDIFNITAQAGALLFNAPSGTPTEGQVLEIVIKDNGTARPLTWNVVFDWSPPSTTILGKWKKMFFQWNTTSARWNFMRQVDEP